MSYTEAEKHLNVLQMWLYVEECAVYINMEEGGGKCASLHAVCKLAEADGVLTRGCPSVTGHVQLC